MDIFLIGLLGSLIGGLMLATAVSILFYHEKKQVAKQSNQLMNDLKAIYQEKLGTVTKVSQKMN